MPSEDDYRSQAEALLRLAAATNMRDRSRLIDEAMHWHNRAIEVRNGLGEIGEDPAVTPLV